MRKALSRTSLPSPGDKQQEDRESGLHALAEMIATSYKRRITGVAGTAQFSSRNDDATRDVKGKTVRYAEPEDRRREGEYTETVKVESFLRRKAPQVKKSRTPRSV